MNQNPANTIAIVEDNRDNRDLLCKLLKSRGYPVLTAGSAAQFWELLELNTVKLILLDIQLPDAHGLALVRQLRALEAYRTTPVIAITALAMPGDEEKALQAGCTHYVPKPIEIFHLMDLIQEIFRSL